MWMWCLIYVALSFFSICCLITWGHSSRIGLPRVVCHPEFDSRALGAQGWLRKPYSPTIWAFNGHLQSALFAMWIPFRLRPLTNSLSFTSQIVTVADGGSFKLDWAFPQSVLPSLTPTPHMPTGVCVNTDVSENVRRCVQGPQRKGIVLIMPGGVGESKNPYCKRLCVALSQAGYLPLVKGWRGIGTLLTNGRPETWDHKAVEDTHAVLCLIQAMAPAIPIFIIGFSLGGTVATNYAGSQLAESAGWGSASSSVNGQSRNPGLVAVVSLSGTFVMDIMLEHIDTKAIMYSRLNTKIIQKHAANYPDEVLEHRSVNRRALTQARCATEWHHAFTLSFTTHSTVTDYFRSLGELTRASAARAVVPLLVLHAQDDPLCPPHTWCELSHAASTNKNLLFVETRGGGHCGWFAGWQGHSWVDPAVIQFLDYYCDSK